MAALLRSGSVCRIFSGLRRSLTTHVPRHDALALHSIQGHPLCPTITRMLSAQRQAENVSPSSQGTTQGIDRALFRIDTDIRRTGRIYLRDIEDIFSEIKTLKRATSTQSLLLLRCCGSLVPEERPEVRNELVQDIWGTLQDLGVPLDISHYNTLLRVYLENNHKFSPTEFLAELERNGVEPNRVTYQRLISRYCQEGDIEGATKILEFMKEKELPVGENIFNALITGHARANDLASAQGVLEVMQESGLEPTTDSYAALMVAYAEAGDAQGLTRTLDQCESAELTLHDRDLLEAVYSLATHGHLHILPLVLERLHKQQGYTQDAMNAIYRLINAGCDEVAHQVFSTMRVPQTAESQPQQTPFIGAFFIRHLVKSGTTPITKVVEYCHDLIQRELNPLALETALNSALMNGRPEEALFLMRVMKDEGSPARPHYFWPIFLHHGRNGDTQKVFNTAREMLALDSPVTLETLRHYTIPSLAQQGHVDMEATIAGLKDAGIQVPVVVNGLLAYLLDTGNIAEAAKLVSRYRVRVKPVLRRDLSDQYVRSGEVSAAVALLGQIVNIPQGTAGNEETVEEESAAMKDAEEEGDSAVKPQQQQQQQDIAAMFLLDVVAMRQRANSKVDFLALLQEMEHRGIGISPDGATAVRAKLGANTEQSLLDALDKLSSRNLTFQPLSREPLEPYSQCSLAELEQRLLELQNKNLPSTNLRNYILLAYIRAKSIDKAAALKKKIEAEQIPLGTGVCVLLVDMYVGAGMLQEAMDTLEELMSREPDTKLTPHKCLRLGSLMAQHGQVEEAVKLVEQHIEDNTNTTEDTTGLAIIARRFLEQLVEKVGLEPARRILDLLLANKVLPVSSALFSPLIKAHLIKDDLDGALKEFESVCELHNITPYKLELTNRCITLEDGEKLQKIMDLSIKVHGELNSLYDMVFAFVECGRVRQARKLLETPGLRAFNSKLDQKCQWLKENGKVEELANLVSVTKDIFDIDRNMMYFHLLKAYVQQKDPDKALGVWTSMQEEDHRPTDKFLMELGQFLKNSRHEVPFEMPEMIKPPPSTSPHAQALKSSASQETSRAQFRHTLNQKNWSAALKLKKQVEESGVQLSVTERSQLVEGLIQAGQLDQATEVALDMMATGTHPTPRILKFLMVVLSGEGRVEPLLAFKKYVTEHNLKRRVSYDNLLCTAYAIAGRPLEVLEALEEDIRSTPDTCLQEVAQNFPRGGIMGILEKYPEYLPKVEALAEQYAAQGLTIPMNCVWMHLFGEGQYTQADQIYQNHLRAPDSMLMFRNILSQAKKKGDATLPARLIEVVQEHPGISSTARGIIYSCWIDVLSSASKFEEGLNVLSGALKTHELTDINTTTLSRLKEGLESSGQAFPHVIPSKESRDRRRAAAAISSSSSSSNSSDSD